MPLRNIRPDLIEGLDVYIDDALDDHEEPEGEPELQIVGFEREGPRTIFVEKLPDDFEINCKNILGKFSK